ncbi:MAG: putative integral rane protein [Glaciihabitans sp.]|nr:putative integral rane protein [Glaciihabitans sp.]
MSHVAPSTPAEVFTDIERSEKFRRLKKKHRSFVLPIAVVFLLWYFAYVLLADYAHDFMATPVFGNVNVGLLLGLGQFVTTFAITTWYVVYANRHLDPIAAEIRAENEEVDS